MKLKNKIYKIKVKLKKFISRNKFKVGIAVSLVLGILLVFGFFKVKSYMLEYEWHGRGCMSYATFKGYEESNGTFGNVYDEVRIYYNISVKKGGLRYELKDEDDNVIYSREFCSDEEGYITFDNKEKIENVMEYYTTITKDTDVLLTIERQVKVYNWEMLVHEISSVIPLKDGERVNEK